MKNALKQEQYKLWERNGQLFFSVNTEMELPATAPVRLASAQLEELDYRQLYRAYSPKGRKSKVDPRVLFKIMQITKSVSGERKSEQERGSDTMGMKHFVRFGLYQIKGLCGCGAVAAR